MEWYEELDFDENPFSVDPRENHNNLISMEELIDEIQYRIKSGSMLVIEGDKGTGKTSLLMVAARKFGGRKKVVYIDAEKLDKKLNITKVLQERYGILGRIFDKKPKDMIVLMDNVHVLSNKNTERLKYYFDQNYIRSIIFTTEKYSKAKFSDSLRDRIGKRVMKIPVLEDYEVYEMIKKRIGESDLFNETVINKVYELSPNPKDLLTNCEKLSKNAVEKKRKRVQMVDIKILKSD